LVGALPGRKRVYSDIGELRNSPTVQKWLEGLRAGPHRTTALYNFARFIRWRKARGLESDPKNLVEDCLAGTNRTLINHLNALVEYCQGGTFRESSLETRKKNFKDVVSFYRAHFITLPKARINGDSRLRVRTEITASKFLDFTKTVLLKARLTPKARAVILTMLQSGMDASTLAEVFNIFGYPQLVNHFGTDDFRNWDLRRCPVRIDLIRPKSQYRYYTFLDVDAIEALKDWLERRKTGTCSTMKVHRPKGPSDLPTSEPIFTKRDGRTITASNVGEIFRDSGKKAGVNVVPPERPDEFKGASNRYPFHSHEVRDTMITLARSANADISAINFFVGHSIDKLKYDRSPWNSEEYFRAEYLKVARPSLNIVSHFETSHSAATGSREIEEKLRAEFDARLRGLEAQMELLLSRQLPGVS